MLAAARAGLGIRRAPWLTAVVIVVTVIPSCLQFAVPGMLTTLERTPAGLGAQWWRSVTALLVQDGGVPGTISNLVFLALIGVIAEQVMSRPRWLVLYLGAGLAGEFAAYAWQPVGAGNSVAICGLAGGLAVLMVRGDLRLPAATPYVQLLWAGALVATVSAIPAVLIFVGTAPALSIQHARRLPATRIAGAAVLACGAALAAVQNIHGAALLAGMLIGAVIVTQKGRRRGHGIHLRPGVRAPDRGGTRAV